MTIIFRGRGVTTQTSAPSGATLLSQWKLDGNGVDAQAIANLLINGTWETGVDPLLADAGTSVGFNGSDAYGIAAHTAPYAVTSGSVVAYVQPDSVPASGQRCIIGKGTFEPNELQVEQRRNASGQSALRAYIIEDDGSTIRYANDAADGIVEIAPNIAHLVVVTFGPSGFNIYHRPAGGSVTLVGTHATTAGIDLNDEDWFVGRSPYGGAFFDGVIDEVRIYSGQLTLSEVQALPAPVTITHGGASPGEELTVPSLSEWLMSDEADPSVTKYVSNQNRGTGDGSSPANAQEVQAALTGASAGQTFLAVCQSPGVVEFWDYPSGLTFNNGSAGNLITLQAQQGDGVVISAAEDFAGARTPSSGFWTQTGLSGDDISKQIWKSSSTFNAADEDMMGFWIEFGHPHQLMRYSSLTNLRAAYGTSDSPTNYAGPGVHKDSSGVVWIRMQRPHVDKYSTDNKWPENTWWDNPEAITAGELVYPISQDPNDYVIHLFRVETNEIAFDVGTTGHHVKIGNGINSLGFRHALTGTDIQAHHGTHLTWMDFISIASSGNSRTNYYLNRIRCSDGSKLHASRGEWKFGGWLEGIRSACFRMQGTSNLANIYWEDCTIADYHELFVGDTNANQIRFRNCTVFNILDDGIQAQHNMSRVEIGYCYFRSSAYGGMGQNGTEGNDANPGGWFIHHNVFDNRFARNTNWRAQPHPHFMYVTHSPDGNSPRKTYNNTIMWGPDNEEEMGPMLMHCPAGNDNTFTTAALMHEVFNNIVLRVFLEGSTRYDAISSLGAAYSDNSQNRSDYVNGRRWVRYSADFSNELFDYNLYWRPAGMSVNGLFRDYARGSSQSSANFASLSDWLAHPEFEHSKNSGALRGAYTPGFDGNSTDTAPQMPAIDNYPIDRFKYRPSPTSAVTTAASGSLSGANWWSTPPGWGATYFPWNDGERTLAPSAWKGALDPNGSTLPVGVQNP